MGDGNYGYPGALAAFAPKQESSAASSLGKMGRPANTTHFIKLAEGLQKRKGILLMLKMYFLCRN